MSSPERPRDLAWMLTHGGRACGDNSGWGYVRGRTATTRAICLRGPPGTIRPRRFLPAGFCCATIWNSLLERTDTLPLREARAIGESVDRVIVDWDLATGDGDLVIL